MNTVSATRQPRRVTRAFIAPLALVLAFIMAVFALAIYLVETRIREQDLAERSAAVASLFAEKLDKDGNLMMATMRALMTNRSMADALARGDRDALARAGDALFAALRRDHRITHLYVTGPDLVNLHRFHSPEEHGDAIQRTTTLLARERQAAAQGLELGSMGTLTLRLVVPWRQEGRLLGYLEIGEEIEHLLDDIRRSLAVDLLALVDKQHLPAARWQRGQALMQRNGDWNRFARQVSVAQTAALPAALDEAVLDRLLAGQTAEIRDRGHSLHLAQVPIAEAGGRPIGHLVVMRDISSLEATFQWSIAAVTLISLLVAGGVLGVFYLALERVDRDYRRQHDLEHQLLRLNKEHQRILQLEKLSALGTMVGSIAHQLNNPLVGVVNLAQLAQREADHPERTRELLQEIRSAGEDCRAFVRRMLDFAKVSCLESRPTPMAELIEDTVLLFRQTETRHLPVDVELPPEPVLLTVDPILIRHALFNLLVNAAQATTDDSPITISLAPAPEPGGTAPGWLLAVTDRGRGIPPEDMDRIFVPFFTTRADGTGLGLPVVQQVALLHGGQVTAASSAENGTRLAIWLPKSEAP